MAAQGDLAALPSRLGRYELISRIAQGGMAEVQLALQRGPAGFEKLVVVKLVHENLASQRPFVEMLLDEARVAALVKHPNVVDIYDLGEVDGRYFIAMEYLEGEPLLAVLRAGRDGTRLDPLSTARVIADTAEGLDAAHELRSLAGVPLELVHHDVSLGNIVVLYTGQVKLVDFGVAKARAAAGSTKVEGKFSYMAPEKLRGASGDRRSDIWSLGCVFWEALTLRRLFRGGNDFDTMKQVIEASIPAPSEVNGDVPRDFDAVVMRALARDPARRYATAKAMASEIEEALRRSGYPAKNDAIAEYMQAAFRDHLAARKKLLQEVSIKGRASRDVLEAAFAVCQPPSGTPLARPPTAQRLASGGDRFSEASSSFGMVTTGPGAQRSAVQAAADAPTLIEPARPVTARFWRLYAGAAVLVVVASAAAVLLLGGGEPVAAPVAAPAVIAAGPAPGAEADRAPALPSPEAVPGFEAEAVPAAMPEAPAVAATEAVAKPRTVEHTERTDSASGPRRAPAARLSRPAPGPTERAADRLNDRANDQPNDRASDHEIDPDALTKEGVQAWVRGDARAALALCRRVTQSEPGHAPAWRLLGLVHEQLGDRSAARSAFEHYLRLAPGAADAAGIRARMEGL